MLEKLLGPKHTFEEALLVLEQGLRNGSISVDRDLASSQAPDSVEVYIRLLNEGTNTLRPTTGLRLGPDVVQVLATKDYDPAIEQWEFPPGSKVKCVSELNGNRQLLVARHRIV